ncbi:MAG: TonB-dependent receptor plug domain-containing protein [Gemmatimonadetes bacterium]|nr:TonB-dependent receptor plug domain-containing protein [Gemmatimonadota bacterium]
MRAEVGAEVGVVRAAQAGPGGFSRHKCFLPVLALGLVLVMPVSVHGQSTDMTGIVVDSLTNEVLPNVQVTLGGSSFGTLTDAFGRFSFVGLPSGPLQLTLEHLAYRTLVLELAGVPTDPLRVLLAPDAIELSGIRVRAQTPVMDAGRGVSRVSIAPEQIQVLPSLGEPDIFRSLQLLPGVSGTNDATSGLFVRGGTPDENLVLLDGMTVYHVDHFFGIFSAFNADAIKDVELYKAAYPARYGGRTSSVVNMIGRAGDPQAFRASAGVNLLSARSAAEIPLGDAAALMVTARRSYTDVIQSGLFNTLFNTLSDADEAAETQQPQGFGGRRRRFEVQEATPSFYFYDVNAKLTWTPTSRDVMAASLYSGADNLDQSSTGQAIQFGGNTFNTPNREEVTDWGNRGVSGRWFRQWGSRFSSDAQIAASEYFSDGTREITSDRFANGFLEENRVQDLSLRLDNTWTVARSSTVEFGTLVTRSDVRYSFEQLQGDSVRGSLALAGDALQTSGYVQNVWTGPVGLTLTVGARGTHSDATGKAYFEPRASLELPFSTNFRFKGAWGRYNQFIKRVENEDILEGSRDFWVLADSVLPPTSAEHRVLGVSYETQGFLFDLEGYHKSLDGVTQFSTRSRRGPGQALDELFFSGTGVAKGLELLVQKKVGPLTGWVSYTLSRVEYDLDDFNNGQPFPASHDQTHEFKTVGIYQMGPWAFSGTWVYGSGRPFTAPESEYVVELLDGTSSSYIHVGDKNAERLPAYHRLDLGATRRFESDRFFYEINVSAFNAYGHDNVWYRKFDLSEGAVVVTDVTTLPFTPSIGFRMGIK